MTVSSARRLYSFSEARRIARGHSFSSRREFLEYECPGAYSLPKNPEVVWQEDWCGWDDFLGVPYDFETAREIVRAMKLCSQQEYLKLMEKPTEELCRLPYRPDLYYSSDGWISWSDWLE